MERVNYDGAINGGLELFGRDGNDTFVLDDNLAPTTIFGDAGDDTFQIGQVFASPRDGTNPNNGLAPADYFQTTPTTQGFLSNGISAPTTIFGGTGDDSFTVYHNLAELFLYGQEDDDTFTVRAFVKVNPNDPKAPFTNINGGAGRRLHLLHRQRAGADRRRRRPRHARRPRHRVRRRLRRHRQGRLRRRPLHHVHGVEKVVVDGEAGNDRFYVQSSSPNVELELVGGLGSDTFNVGGSGTNTPITVVSNSLNGHSGLVAQPRRQRRRRRTATCRRSGSRPTSPTTTRPGVMITQISPIVVFESAGAPVGMVQSRYSIVLTQAPTEDVHGSRPRRPR